MKNVLISLVAILVSSSALAEMTSNHCPRSRDCKCAARVSFEACKKLGGGPQVQVGKFKKRCQCKYQ